MNSNIGHTMTSQNLFEACYYLSKEEEHCFCVFVQTKQGHYFIISFNIYLLATEF